MGLSVGLAAFSRCDLKDVCAWDAAQTEICAIHASALGNECHVLLAVDEMGQCALGFPALSGDELCSGDELAVPQSTAGSGAALGRLRMFLESPAERALDSLQIAGWQSVPGTL